jgi:hypothetical protein
MPPYSVCGRCRPRDGPERTRPTPADHWFGLVVNWDDTQPRAASSSPAQALGRRVEPRRLSCPDAGPFRVGLDRGGAGICSRCESFVTDTGLDEARHVPATLPLEGGSPADISACYARLHSTPRNPFVYTHQQSR